MDELLSDLEIVEDFVDEATERLDLVADHALSAESGDREAWHALRREIHTLKGAAGFLGLDAFSELCHELEDFLLRTSPSHVGDAFDTVHEAVEHLRELVDEVNEAAHQGVPLAPSARATLLSSRLRAG